METNTFIPHKRNATKEEIEQLSEAAKNLHPAEAGNIRIGRTVSDVICEGCVVGKAFTNDHRPLGFVCIPKAS